MVIITNLNIKYIEYLIIFLKKILFIYYFCSTIEILIFAVLNHLNLSSREGKPTHPVLSVICTRGLPCREIKCGSSNGRRGWAVITSGPRKIHLLPKIIKRMFFLSTGTYVLLASQHRHV